MDIQQLRLEVDDLLKDGEVERALAKTLQYIKVDSTGYNDFLSLQSRLARAKKNLEIGMMKHDDFEVAMTQITRFLRDLLEKTDQAFVAVSPIRFYRILIITQAADKDTIDKFIGRTELDCQVTKQTEFKEDDKNYDVIVFDNRFMKKCKDLHHLFSKGKREKDRYELMKSYAEQCSGDDLPDTVLLHFGEEAFFVGTKEFKKCMYASNSFFSLYHRILEALEFIRITRKPQKND